MEKAIQVALAFALMFAGMEVGKRLGASMLTPSAPATAAPAA